MILQEADKIELAQSIGLDQKQVNNRIINQRKRHRNHLWICSFLFSHGIDLIHNVQLYSYVIQFIKKKEPSGNGIMSQITIINIYKSNVFKRDKKVFSQKKVERILLICSFMFLWISLVWIIKWVVGNYMTSLLKELDVFA